MNRSPQPEPVDGDGRHLLATAVRWFWTAILGALLGLALLGIDIAWRAKSQDRPAAAYMDRLGLPQQALAPAGSALRRPDAPHPGLDLRFSPCLPRSQGPALPLLFFEDQPERGMHPE
jgi:hypothetical protein